MDQVIEARTGLVHNFSHDVRVGEMAFGAGELLVVSSLPAAVDEFHAVAGCTKFRAS